MQQLKQFQAFLYANIPLVKHMQLQLCQLDQNNLTAQAPLAPNINDKATVFGGSSAALMTICGWSLIKFNLEINQIENDVVVRKSQLKWDKAQSDDLIITATLDHSIDWQQLAEQLQSKNRSIKVPLQCQVMDQADQVCSQMTGEYVILKN